MKKKSVILSAVIVLGLWMIWVAQYAFWWSLFWTDIYKQTLAWEAVPFDSLHQFNIERFDRELAVVRLDEAQVQMNWKRAWIFKPMIEKKLSAAWLPLDLFYYYIRNLNSVSQNVNLNFYYECLFIFLLYVYENTKNTILEKSIW